MYMQYQMVLIWDAILVLVVVREVVLGDALMIVMAVAPEIVREAVPAIVYQNIINYVVNYLKWRFNLC